jgi:hypothetical protein
MEGNSLVALLPARGWLTFKQLIKIYLVSDFSWMTLADVNVDSFTFDFLPCPSAVCWVWPMQDGAIGRRAKIGLTDLKDATIFSRPVANWSPLRSWVKSISRSSH